MVGCMLACGALGSIPSTKKKEQEKEKQPNKAWRVPGLEQQSVNAALGNTARYGTCKCTCKEQSPVVCLTVKSDQTG